MPFRRYGGDINPPTKDGGNVGVLSWGMVFAAFLFVVGTIANKLAFFGIGLFVLIGSAILCLLVPGGSTSNIKEERQLKALKKAAAFLESGRLDDATEQLRRAKMHGDLPSDFAHLEQDIASKKNT